MQTVAYTAIGFVVAGLIRCAIYSSVSMVYQKRTMGRIYAGGADWGIMREFLHRCWMIY